MDIWNATNLPEELVASPLFVPRPVLYVATYILHTTNYLTNYLQ